MFTVNGKQVGINVLYYYSVAAISRALRFRAEAVHQFENATENGNTLAGVAIYYSIFHLGVFLACCCPLLLKDKVFGKVERALKNKEDPSRALSHHDVQDFIKTCCAKHGLDGKVIDILDTSKDIREFLNYAPDLKPGPKGEYEFHNLKHSPNELSVVIQNTDSVFDTVIAWACANGIDNGIIVPGALGSAANFLTEHEDGHAYFSGWSSDAVLRKAEAFRSTLQRNASQRVYRGDENQSS